MRLDWTQSCRGKSRRTVDLRQMLATIVEVTETTAQQRGPASSSSRGPPRAAGQRDRGTTGPGFPQSDRQRPVVQPAGGNDHVAGTARKLIGRRRSSRSGPGNSRGREKGYLPRFYSQRPRTRSSANIPGWASASRSRSSRHTAVRCGARNRRAPDGPIAGACFVVTLPINAEQLRAGQRRQQAR